MTFQVRPLRNAPAAGNQDSSGDHAGSDAKLGVGTRCSLRPVMSTATMAPVRNARRKATDNDKLVAEGKADQTKADAKKAGENVKDAFKKD